MPIAFTSIGETEPVAQLPVLLKSQFEVREGLQTGCSEGQTENEKFHANEVHVEPLMQHLRGKPRRGIFSFVEPRNFRLPTDVVVGWICLQSRYDGVGLVRQGSLGPTLEGLLEQGTTLSDKLPQKAYLATHSLVLATTDKTIPVSAPQHPPPGCTVTNLPNRVALSERESKSR